MSLLEADRRRIAEIDAQISELETALSDLRAKKAFAQERLDSYKYPVLTLPPEIVSEIFTHFLPTYPDRPYLTGGLSPRRLTHICRAWRDIALGTPSLWRAMILHREGAMILHPEGDDIPLAQLARELDIWARRSGRCPMAVEFEFLPDTQLSAEVLLTSIAAQSARLEYLVLYLEDTDSLHPFSGPMPRLRHLDLNFEDDESTPVLVFSEAPLLRTALLTFNPAKRMFPSFGAESKPNILPPSPYLGRRQSKLSRHHPSLPTSLKLEEDPITDYLNTLTVPSLRCLDLTEDFLGSDPLRYLASFISKSGCKLQELIMSERPSISRSAYREAFPSIKFSFTADGEATDGSEALG